jgi:Flp pilus assembly pilin Flp
LEGPEQQASIGMNRFWKIVREDSGTTTAEYAVVIALIVAALVLASDGMRWAANSTFHRTAAALGTAPYGAATNFNHDNADGNQDPAFATVQSIDQAISAARSGA